MENLIPVRDASERVVAYAKVDPGFDWLRSYPWHRLTADGPVVTLAAPLARGKLVPMGHVVLGLGDSEVTVSHRNGNVLDNRRANLQVATDEAPRPQPSDGPRRSRYRHVLWDAAHETWVAYGYAAGKYVHLGRFDDERAAAAAAHAWAIENQNVHFEGDHAVGGFGRAMKAPE